MLIGLYKEDNCGCDEFPFVGAFPTFALHTNCASFLVDLPCSELQCSSTWHDVPAKNVLMTIKHWWCGNNRWCFTRHRIWLKRQGSSNFYLVRLSWHVLKDKLPIGMKQAMHLWKRQQWAILHRSIIMLSSMWDGSWVDEGGWCLALVNLCWEEGNVRNTSPGNQSSRKCSGVHAARQRTCEGKKNEQFDLKKWPQWFATTRYTKQTLPFTK